MNIEKYKIILASKSPRRSQLLREAGFKFEVKTMDVDESFPADLDRAEVAGFIARKKAMAAKDLIKGDHLIILHHKLIWMPDHPVLDAQAYATTNGMVGDCFFCLMNNNFYKEIYPELVKLEQNGIEVIMVAGDIGSKVNQFEYKTKEGIVLLATGLEDGREDNQVLVFEYDKGSALTWKFEGVLSHSPH